MGNAKIRYATAEDGMLSFKINAPVRVLSKSAGNNPKLWGVEISGRRGYANKDFIKENKILIKETDLKYEVPVVWPNKPKTAAAETAAETAAVAAPATAPIASNPQVEQKPEQPLEQTQPVLNSSETAEDIATTTTSPLDTIKLAILTEQEQSSSSEVPSPITPVQPNLQLVDGTELPLEAVPALTERNQNVSHADEVKTATNSHKAELEDPTTGDEEFDYEDDEENIEDDDNDNEATLDSKVNDKQNDSNADNKATVQVIATSAAAAVAAEASGQQANGSNVSHSKPENLTVKNEDAPPEVAAKPIEASLLVETRNVSAELDEDKLRSDSKAETVEEDTQPRKEPEMLPAPEANEIDNNLPKIEPKIQLMSRQIPESNDKEKAAAEALPNQTEATTEQQIEIPNQLEEAAKVNSSNVVVEAETKAQQATEPQAVVEAALPSANETVKAAEEAPIAAKVVAAIVPNETTQQEVKADADAAQPKKAEIAIESPEPQAAVEVDSSTPRPTEEPIGAATLSPLFKQQHFNNPNEYYKQLQEQQQQQKQKQEQEQKELDNEQKPLDQQQKEQLEKQEQEKQQQLQKEDQLRQQQQLEEQQRQQALEEQEKLRQQEDEQRQQQLEEQLQREEQQRQQKLKEQQQEQEKLRQQQLQEQEERRRQQQKEKEQQLQRQREKQKQQQQQQQQQEQQHIQHTTPSATAFDPYDAIDQAEPTPAPATRDQHVATGSVEPVGLPTVPAETPKEEVAPGPGLFSTIMNTVNSFISNEDQKVPKTEPLTGADDLHRLLYPEAPSPKGKHLEIISYIR